MNDTATTEIYTLSLHDALPISRPRVVRDGGGGGDRCAVRSRGAQGRRRGLPQLPGVRPLSRGRDHAVHRRVDRKSTRLNSSHSSISYAVFCLKKKNKSTMRKD